MQKEDNYTFLTQEPIPKVIGTMAIPTIIAMLITNLYNIVDTYFVGKINTQATAAVGIVFSVMFFIQAFSFFFGNGSGNYISRELGSKNRRNAEQMASTALGYAFISSIIIVVFGLIFLDKICIFLGSTSTILPYTRQYLGISLLGIPFIMCTLCMNNQMRFQGYARYSMYGIVVGALLNCVLDPLFIFTFNMGIRGAAIATVTGQAVGFVVMYAMSRHKDIIHYTPRNFSHRGMFIKEIIAGGTPSLSRQGLASIATIALNVSASHYGDAAIAAMSIVNRITMFIFSMIIGLGHGYQPMCGFCYGAKRYERVKAGFWFCVKLGTSFLFFWAVILFIFSAEAIELFRNDFDVISIGTRALRYQLLTFPLWSFILMSNMIMQTCRKTFRANLLAASRQGLFFIPLIFILPHYLGLTGVEICQACGDFITLLLTAPIMFFAFREMRV